MLYELISVIKPGGVQQVKDVARTAGALVLAQGGVVRGFTYWGQFLLTKPVTRDAKRHDSGHHFIMRFDASPAAQASVRKTVAVDPRTIRCSSVKVGATLRETYDVPGHVEWRRTAKGGTLDDYAKNGI